MVAAPQIFPRIEKGTLKCRRNRSEYATRRRRSSFTIIENSVKIPVIAITRYFVCVNRFSFILYCSEANVAETVRKIIVEHSARHSKSQTSRLVIVAIDWVEDSQRLQVTDKYPISGVSANNPGLGQFHSIDDQWAVKDDDASAANLPEWASRAKLHAMVYAEGEKYSVLGLQQYSARTFLAAFCEQDETKVDSVYEGSEDHVELIVEHGIGQTWTEQATRQTTTTYLEGSAAGNGYGELGGGTGKPT